MEPKKVMEGVRMALGALDCPRCDKPLAPPIYQCGVGHLICQSCCIKLNKCHLCPRSSFERCLGMERVVESIEVPCCFAKNGCTQKVAYINKAEHEKACPHRPCFCPEPGCGFKGSPSPAALRDHFTGHHKWPSTAFGYCVQFVLRLEPGPHVLHDHAKDGSSVFLVNVVAAPSPVEPHGHAVSLVCVRQPAAATGSKRSGFSLSLTYSRFEGHHQVVTLLDVRSSSLADGLPKDVVCLVHKASGDDDSAVLRITIKKELAAYKLEDVDSEDESSEEDDE